MKNILKNLESSCGYYEGEGINHEGQAFVGRLSLKRVLSGRGVSIEFSATGADGTVYHLEESRIAPDPNEKLVLWNFNSNSPGLVPHELRSSAPKSGALSSFLFGFNDSSAVNSFREEVALDIWSQSEISYTYSWGLPGGEYKERSGLRMVRKGPSLEKVEFLSASLLVSKDPDRLAKFYRDVIGVPLEAEDHGETKPHYGCELGDIHFAIHPLENFKDTGFGAGSIKLAFTVFNMNEFVKRIENQGVKFAYPTKDLGFAKMTALTDPDGNYIEFTELSPRWYQHLEKRRSQGYDVIEQWRRQ
jgi:predicted enzyme related to lactoylglutathione lyase